MHDELTLHNMKSIVQKCLANKKINKIDPILCQSTYMGNSVFHLCYNKFQILECLHMQVCGTRIPGEVGDVFVPTENNANSASNPNQDSLSFAKTVSFEAPWFRRLV